jgi:diphosphomevalonate decarboxylase
MKNVTVTTHPNIALIKYWGKRDKTLFLPTRSSLSFTLNNLSTTTTISLSQYGYDDIILNDHYLSKPEKDKVVRFLDIFRNLYQVDSHFIITSRNSFPTAAGVASSSSGYAALALGLNNLCNLKLSHKELSMLARRGSGSACRSVYPGFVLWHKGERDDGKDSYAEQLFPPEYWPEFRIIVAIVDAQTKGVSSRIAMQRTITTSPGYSEWVDKADLRISKMIRAIEKKDLVTVGTIAEQDCIDMHTCMQTSTPPVQYWTQGTKNIIAYVAQLRKTGIPCYFTIDAGPNVKIITLDAYVEEIVCKLKQNCPDLQSVVY